MAAYIGLAAATVVTGFVPWPIALAAIVLALLGAS